MNLRNKRILITAGPTWVPIDKVRVISNVASGETGIILAQELIRSGARVTLLLGPSGVCCLDKRIRLLRFRFFDELKNKITRELRWHKYDVVIHSAAVSDYRPSLVFAQKVKSDKKIWQLNLVPTVKIIDLIKKIDPSVFLAGFKFEPGAGKNLLIKRARGLIKRAGLDLAVANSVNRNQYRAYIISRHGICGPLRNKASLAKGLLSAIGENLWKK
jgi:phosphopantothenoylcysteine decarboxylase/phosphopantothenate--cysteine ligase